MEETAIRRSGSAQQTRSRLLQVSFILFLIEAIRDKIRVEESMSSPLASLNRELLSELVNGLLSCPCYARIGSLCCLLYQE